MNSRNVCVAILFLLFSGWQLTAQAELIGNGGFDAPLSAAEPGADGFVDTGRSWIFFLNNGAQGAAALEAGEVKVVPEKIDAPAYGIQLIQGPVLLEKGGDYEFSFDARSTEARTITIKLGGTASRSWTAYSGEKKVAIGTEMKRYIVAFTMNQPDDKGARAEFWFTEGAAPVWIDNVALVKKNQAVVGPAPVSGTKTKADEDALTKWEPVWSDEFDGKGIDGKNWGFELGNNGGWGNNELEVYTDKPANASIQKVDGTSSLVITARQERVKDGDRTYQLTSARMTTKFHFSMASGKLEVRAKLPRGQGLWPAIWLLGANIDSVSWPDCGEIDLMEFLGHDLRTVYSTVHGPISAGPGVGQPYRLPEGQSFADDFHVFTLEWRPDHLEFLVDGHLFFVASKPKIQYEVGPADWVYDHPYFLILNVAVGGNWPGNPNGSTRFPQSMAVDYVRVFRNVGAELGPGEMQWVP